jgi:hypothetical protein
MWSRHWFGCIREAAEADGETACGGLLEAGAALAADKRVFVVSPDWWSFANHPRCRSSIRLQSAVEAIMAGANATEIER